MNLALIVALASALQPTTHPQVEAFKAGCLTHHRDHTLAAPALAAAGWARVDETDHAELAASLALTRKSATENLEPDERMDVSFSVWRKTWGGRPMHLVLNRTHLISGETKDEDGDGEIQSWEKAFEITLLGCGVWDFDATEPLPVDALNVWIGAEPVQVIDEPGMVSGGTWNIQHMNLGGTGEIQAGFMPEGSTHPLAVLSGTSITFTVAPEGD